MSKYSYASSFQAYLDCVNAIKKMPIGEEFTTRDVVLKIGFQTYTPHLSGIKSKIERVPGVERIDKGHCRIAKFRKVGAVGI